MVKVTKEYPISQALSEAQQKALEELKNKGIKATS